MIYILPLFAMAISRKCAKCKVWTESLSHCSECGEVLDHELIQAKREQERKEYQESLPPSKLDVFFHEFKNSRFLLIRVFYRLLYSIWFIMFSIVSFFIALIAAGPG